MQIELLELRVGDLRRAFKGLMNELFINKLAYNKYRLKHWSRRQ